MVRGQTFGGKVIERRVRQIMQLRVPVIGDEPAAVFCLGVVLFSQRLIECGRSALRYRDTARRQDRYLRGRKFR